MYRSRPMPPQPATNCAKEFSAGDCRQTESVTRPMTCPSPGRLYREGMSTSPRDQSPLFYNAKPKPAEPRKLSEPLWTLTRGVERIAAELRHHGQWGSELQLFRDGEFFYGQRYETREIALLEAADYRQQLEADGWTPP